jgi:hypothetical protein
VYELSLEIMCGFVEVFESGATTNICIAGKRIFWGILLNFTAENISAALVGALSTIWMRI